MKQLLIVCLLLLAVAGVFPAAAGRLDRFALVLEDAPVAARIESRKDLARSAATDALGRIRTAQDALRQALGETEDPRHRRGADAGQRGVRRGR